MEAKDMFRNINFALDFFESYDYYVEFSQIENIDDFNNNIESLSYDKRKKIANGLLYNCKKSKDFETKDKFIEKYNQYIIKKVSGDIKQYLNNSYCYYLYNKSKDKFINDKSIKEIDLLLEKEFYNIFNKIRNNIKINDEEHLYIKNIFLDVVYNYGGYKQVDGENDFMYELVEYFETYPIKAIEKPEDKLFSLLYILSKRMIEFPGNCAIKISNDYEYTKNSKILGYFTIVYDDISKSNIPVIVLNGIDIYEIDTTLSFFEKLHTIFHELRHQHQKLFYDSYTTFEREIIDMEKVIIHYNPEFYSRYHDSFFIEKDANNYAASELKKEYEKEYPREVRVAIGLKYSEDIIKFEDFYKKEKEVFNKIINDMIDKKKVVK